MGTESGFPDDWRAVLGADGFVVVVDHSNSDVIYSEYQHGYLMKSTDRGYSFTAAINGMDYETDRHNWKTPYVMDPNDHLTLYYGSQRLYRTTDGAQNWTAISGDLTDGPGSGNTEHGTITAIAVAPSNPNTIYVGTDDANVWRSTNAGLSFDPVHATLPNRWVTSIAVDPLDEAIAYVTLSGFYDGKDDGYVYRTDDWGDAWTALTGGSLPALPVNDIIVDPDLDATLYVGTDAGVYVTHNLGGLWEPLGVGLPIEPILDLDFHPATRKLAAATYGNSIYATHVTCPGMSDTDGDCVEDVVDNCPSVFNPLQTDTDFDGIGDVCDDCPYGPPMPTDPPDIFWTKTHDRDDTTKITIMDMCETMDGGYCLTGTLEFDGPQVHYIAKIDAAGNVE